MPGIDGLELLRQIKQRWPDTEVIMITAHANAASAVEAMTTGAFYYVEKPFRLPDVRKIVGEATQKAALKRENASLKAALDQVASAPRASSFRTTRRCWQSSQRRTASRRRDAAS